MEATIHDGEYILVTKYSYDLVTPELLPIFNFEIPSIRINGLEKIKKEYIAIIYSPSYWKG